MERLKALAMPPRQVFDSVFADEQAITLGAKFNGLYTATLKQSRSDYAAAREQCEAFLARYPEEDQRLRYLR